MFAPNDFDSLSKQKPTEKNDTYSVMSMQEIFQIGVREIETSGDIEKWIARFINLTSIENIDNSTTINKFFNQLNGNFALIFPNTVKKSGSILAREKLKFMRSGISIIFEEASKIGNESLPLYIESAARFIILLDYYFAGYDIQTVRTGIRIAEVIKVLKHLNSLYSIYLEFKREHSLNNNYDDSWSSEHLAG